VLRDDFVQVGFFPGSHLPYLPDVLMSVACA